MKSLTLPALAAILLAGGCATGMTAAPAPAAQAASAALFEVSADKPTAIFSRSGASFGEEGMRDAPLFQVCSAPESRIAADIWLFPDQGSVSDRHPAVKHVPVEPGACVFASGGYIEARLTSGAVQAVSWLNERIETLEATSAASPADAALLVEYEKRRGADPKAWLEVTPIGR